MRRRREYRQEGYGTREKRARDEGEESVGRGRIERGKRDSRSGRREPGEIERNFEICIMGRKPRVKGTGSVKYYITYLNYSQSRKV